MDSCKFWGQDGREFLRLSLVRLNVMLPSGIDELA